ncbi:MAG: hypothetical protein M3O62_16620 [Pseudomonadota bacterium]|nr:hypothetical protein [Pseudomonadota bacterium]
MRETMSLAGQAFRMLRLASLAISTVVMLAGCEGSVPANSAQVADSPPPPGGFTADGGLDVGSPTARDCFWSITEEANYLNVFYLEKYANYWISALIIPPGGHIRVTGEFPHSRYMSFNIYSPTFKPLGVLADVDIQPDEGSINPFVSGADRNAATRNFSIQLLPQYPPEAGREANTLYNYLPLSGISPTIEALLPNALLGIPLPSNVAVLIYRVYVPDTSMNRSGGVDLPDIEIVDGAGHVISGPDVCDFLEPKLPTLVNDFLENAQLGPIELGLSVPPSIGALPQLKWFKYFDLLSTYIHHSEGVPGVSGLPELAALDFARNLDNSYLMGYASQRYGELISLEAKVPSHRSSVRGPARVSDADSQVRYFSFCSNDFYTRRMFDCVYDEEIPTVGSRAIVLAGRLADRPSNARYECGVAWLNWGLFEESMLIYRQMTPGGGDIFAEAIKNVETPSGENEERVMGDYYPRSKYWSRDDFERLGCPVTSAALNGR